MKFSFFELLINHRTLFIKGRKIKIMGKNIYQSCISKTPNETLRNGRQTEESGCNDGTQGNEQKNTVSESYQVIKEKKETTSIFNSRSITFAWWVLQPHLQSMKLLLLTWKCFQSPSKHNTCTTC